MTASPETPVAGLTNARGLGLGRFPIRLREEGVTLSAWRLAVASEQGDGTITRVEVPSGEVVHRGEGVFLGWPQDRLAEAYEILVPREVAAAEESPQLG